MDILEINNLNYDQLSTLVLIMCILFQLKIIPKPEILEKIEAIFFSYPINSKVFFMAVSILAILFEE